LDEALPRAIVLLAEDRGDARLLQVSLKQGHDREEFV
jgi:hypothetical protein